MAFHTPMQNHNNAHGQDQNPEVEFQLQYETYIEHFTFALDLIIGGFNQRQGEAMLPQIF